MSADSIASSSYFTANSLPYWRDGQAPDLIVDVNERGGAASRAASVPVHNRQCSLPTGEPHSASQQSQAVENNGLTTVSDRRWRGLTDFLPARIRHWLGEGSDESQALPPQCSNENNQTVEADDTVSEQDESYYSLTDITNSNNIPLPASVDDKENEDPEESVLLAAEEQLSTSVPEGAELVHNPYRIDPEYRQAKPVESLETVCWVTSIMGKVGLFIKATLNFMKGLFCEGLSNHTDLQWLAKKRRTYEINSKTLRDLGIPESESESEDEDLDTVIPDVDATIAPSEREEGNADPVEQSVLKQQGATNKQKNRRSGHVARLAESLMGKYVAAFASYAEKGFQHGLQAERELVESIMSSPDLSIEMDEYLNLVSQQKQHKGDDRNIDIIKDDVLTDLFTVVLETLNMTDDRLIETYNLFRRGKDNRYDRIVFRGEGSTSALDFYVSVLGCMRCVKSLELPCKAVVLERAVANVAGRRNLRLYVKKIDWSLMA